MMNDWIDYVFGGLGIAFAILVLIVSIFLTTYMISPEKYESVQHNNTIEIKGDIK